MGRSIHIYSQYSDSPVGLGPLSTPSAWRRAMKGRHALRLSNSSARPMAEHPRIEVLRARMAVVVERHHRSGGCTHDAQCLGCGGRSGRHRQPQADDRGRPPRDASPSRLLAVKPAPGSSVAEDSPTVHSLTHVPSRRHRPLDSAFQHSPWVRSSSRSGGSSL